MKQISGSGHREELVHWLQGEPLQNFGDYLSAYLAARLFVPTPRRPGDVRIIGSCLDDDFVPAADPAAGPSAAGPTLTAWATGMRRRGGLSPEAAQRVDIRAVRGPLSARELGLDGTVAIGDSGLLLPVLYRPRHVARLAGCTVCVPHFHDHRSDAEISALTGADSVLRPGIANSLQAVEAFVDDLTSADFLLCGSLHAAVVAAAYGRPFAFWDSGNIDLPFKWQDFAALVGIPAVFQRDMAAARTHYETQIAPALRLPSLWPMVAAAPYFVRPAVLLRVLQQEMARYGEAPPNGLADAIVALEGGTQHLEQIGAQAAAVVDGLANALARALADARSASADAHAAQTDRIAQLAARDAHIAALELARAAAEQRQAQQLAESERDRAEQLWHADELRRQLAQARQELNELQQSSSWRMTALYRRLRDATRPVVRAVEQYDLLYRLVTAPLMLPAYLAYKGDHHGFYKSWRHRSGFVGNLVAAQDVVHDRLQARGAGYRALASTGFAIAARVHEAGGVFSAIGRFGSVLWRQGANGLRSWIKAAEPHPAPASVPSGPATVEALPEDVRGRILVADYRVPRADVSAGERATVGILKDLKALGFDVTFIAKDMEPSPGHAAAIQALGIEVVTRGHRGYDSATTYVAEQGARFGAFYFIRVDVAEMLLHAARRAAPCARIIFQAPDLYFLREMRGAQLQQDLAAQREALRTRQRELAMMQASDHVLLVSPAEVAVLRPELPDTPISLFPVLYAPVGPPVTDSRGRQHVFFLGGFGHTPNIGAVQWFAREIWPHVRAKLPDVEFHIVGAEAPDSVVALGELPGVRFVGYVPRLEPVLESYRVGVAPLLFGAGIKGKVATTMGAGIPCVCTTIAAEGMGIENGVHGMVADDAKRFAEAVIAAYTDAALWQRLSRNGQSLVSDRFGDAANRAALLDVLNAARALPLDLYCRHWTDVAGAAVPAVGDDVDVSIIVPVFNKWALTRTCLSSVIATSRGSGVRYEIIVADDGSTDETATVADVFPGVRLIRSPQNLGFLRNCNHAALAARGRHLLLLNNDTIVLPGWLKALYGTIEGDPTVAIVGSKMLYPDGHVQEAGGGLLSDASGVSIGRWLMTPQGPKPGPRDHPAIAFARETDYASGASMLVRRSFWDAVGGFDERYQPAYCEDSDLAMSARAKGLRVVYEPTSEIVHFEHQTYGEQSSAHRQLMAQNQQRLLAKWAQAFERCHLPPGSSWHRVASHGDRSPDSAARARRKRGALNILYFSPFPSHPASHGNQATIQQFGRRFQALGHRVHFALLQSPLFTPMDVVDMRQAWDSLSILPNTHPLGADGAPIAFDAWYEEGLGEEIATLCARHEIDVVFCSYVFQSKLLEFVPAHVLKVIDTHDKMGNRYEMLRSNGQPVEFFSCTPEEEGAYLRRADVVVARREEEARYFDAVTGHASAIVIPHVEEARFIERDFVALQKVGMVASANRINVALIQDFLGAVERGLAGRPCPFTLHVAGRVQDMIAEMPAEQAAAFDKPWVRWHGFVADIGRFYEEMDVIVAPVTMGTGINVKTVQALAHGAPLLCTAWGSKGIDTDEPEHRHADLDSLVASLLRLAAHPQALQRLAGVSRRCYTAFLGQRVAAFEELLHHPKLLPPAERSHRSAADVLATAA